ncbi:MAG: DUF4863 family protein [Myxococcota bacterium]
MDKSEIKAGRERLVDALDAVLSVVRSVDPADPTARERLESALPADGEVLRALGTLVREGVDAGWLCEREANGVRFSRVAFETHPKTAPLSIDAVSMHGPGPGHTHPHGEIDLTFAVDGEPTFDGQAPGWTVYAPGTWHVPTVRGGSMDILYFLPEGAIRFEDAPSAS